MMIDWVTILVQGEVPAKDYLEPVRQIGASVQVEQLL